ncbi:aspartate/glutamate racemase family protein [uncultured Friedmanniella sp.]|uniref:aspartate/glutamate racemase family protein n=1 Tax=uncultured Friedmanniella sp. TaxID=335381 RepID=UPI0035CAE1E4
MTSVRRIAVVNPNTTVAMTEKMLSCALPLVDPGTELVGVTNTTGPASIESHVDEALAVPGLLREVIAGEAAGISGYVIACFGDPGLDACRELASGPVVGIAEAGMHLATMLGRSFSIVTTLGRTMGQAEHLVQRYGYAGKCRSIYACEVAVLELDEPGSEARKLVVDHCRRAVEYDEADSIVLGCAGMADFCADVSEQVGVPVIDGVTAGVLLVESMIKLGLRTSTRSEYAAPLPKTYR